MAEDESFWLERAIGHEAGGVRFVTRGCHRIDQSRLAELMGAAVRQKHVTCVSVESVIPAWILSGVELRDHTIDSRRAATLAVLGADQVAVGGEVHPRFVGTDSGAKRVTQ